MTSTDRLTAALYRNRHRRHNDASGIPFSRGPLCYTTYGQGHYASEFDKIGPAQTRLVFARQTRSLQPTDDIRRRRPQAGTRYAACWTEKRRPPGGVHDLRRWQSRPAGQHCCRRTCWHPHADRGRSSDLACSTNSFADCRHRRAHLGAGDLIDEIVRCIDERGKSWTRPRAAAHPPRDAQALLAHGAAPAHRHYLDSAVPPGSDRHTAPGRSSRCEPSSRDASPAWSTTNPAAAPPSSSSRWPWST